MDRYIRCGWEVCGSGRCHSIASVALRTPTARPGSSETHFYCAQHGDMLAARGWADVTEEERARPDSLIGNR